MYKRGVKSIKRLRFGPCSSLPACILIENKQERKNLPPVCLTWRISAGEVGIVQPSQFQVFLYQQDQSKSLY